ncbi:hypothetical protein [Micromonospora sp. KC207]|uniref:hypothetical protein n=1 Tax=Micromonospora sp. KC207 TaxID=2530377 RepID=UPI001FB65EAC|nr:hypothetical protein [Micromonospora sp. KC207]
MSSSFVDARQPWVGNAESGGLPSRLPSLTGLRWMAALVVFIYHTSRQSPALVLSEDKQALATWHHVANAAGGVGARASRSSSS